MDLFKVIFEKFGFRGLRRSWQQCKALQNYLNSLARVRSKNFTQVNPKLKLLLFVLSILLYVVELLYSIVENMSL